MEREAKQRIGWVDIAKAIAIFAMIEGHVVVYGGAGRNLIYSFHMPLFLILTGFTMSPKKGKEVWTAIRKDFVKIMLPCIATQTINGILSYMIYDEVAMDSIKLRVEQFIWGSAIDVYGHSCLGMIWYLVLLFWAKCLFYVIQLVFPGKYNGAVFLGLALLGKMLSIYEIYLPQAWDVALMAALFIYLGYAFKQIRPWFDKWCLALSVPCFVIWMYCWEQGFFVELGGRWYPSFGLGILECLAACLCVFTFSKALESCKPVSAVMQAIGRHTLLILCLSHIDWLTVPIWNKGMRRALILRPLLSIGGALVIVLGRKALRRVFRGKG